MPSSTKKPTVKQQLKELVRRLPDNCTVDDVQYELYLLDKIRRGEAAIQRGEVLTHEQVKRRVASWRTR